MKPRIVFVARLLALVWAVFWLVFFLVESLAWHTPALITAAWAGLGVLLVVLALLPWGREAAGGLLLAATGVLVGVFYAIWAPPGLPDATRLITIAVFSLPPVVAGMLFLKHHRTVTAGN